ncbi:glycosyltransferase family 4 protein [Terriglobus roseus]|uniref:Glycosyltransferase involved in cell wall bisynthesis n=1 Tax=Terriglobus roseus TaxID=392734 RepID=A0A1G7JYZ8_9BACT|nr:glycosyltransferase family 4 protein [Terriglobus roseus]SDF30092.1 Glycosyltransferase involved in cell wall bisynthesis [Terriglobus roseus]
MRVLQLVSSSGFYGAERMINLLASSLNQAGEQVYLGLFNADSASCAQVVREADQNSIPVWNLRCRGRWDWRAVHDLANFLKVNRIDVLHTHGYKANIYGFLAARLAGCAIVATCHNWTKRTNALQKYAALDQIFLRWFDTVIAVSQGIITELRHNKVRRIRMIANGIDVAKYQAASNHSRQDQPVVIGCLSRLSKEKGVDVLLWALPRILDRYPNLHCCVAGEGPERESLEALAAKLGVANAFHMPGFCDDTADFLKLCTIVVQPSRMEAMPLAILEAMAAGKAIVASAVGEIPRLLEDGHAGLLVPPDSPEKLADAVLTLLKDEALRQSVERRAAQKAAAQFDVATMTAEYQKVYRTVASTRQPQRHLAHADRMDMQA